MHVGLDWSGAPDRPGIGGNGRFYVCAAVAFRDSSAAEVIADALQEKYGWPANREFKGHTLRKTPGVYADVIRALTEECNFAAIVLDKQRLIAEIGIEVFDKPAKLSFISGILTVQSLLSHVQIGELIVDEGDISSVLHGEFHTTIRQMAASVANGARMQRGHPRHLPSHKWPCIQFADIVAYLLRRDVEGKSVDLTTKKLMQQFADNSGNTVISGREIDLRTYL